MEKLRVLHLFGEYLNPAEIWAYNLLKSFSTAEVHIGAVHYLKNNFYDPSFSFVDNKLDPLMFYNNNLNKKIPRLLLHKLSIKMLPYFLGTFEKDLMRYIKKHRIQILHAHFAPTAWYYRKLANKMKLPLVVSFYGFDYEYYPNIKPEYNNHYQQLFKLADLFLCEGQHGKDILVQKGCVEGKVKVSRLGIDLNQISFRKREKQIGELRLIQVASFAKKKGHIYTLRAFRKALNDCPNMHLTFIGEEKDVGTKEELENYIHAQGLKNRVKILGFLPYKEIIQEFYQHHVFIHPSCYTKDRDCEGGAPIVLLDAQASGLPVISTKHCDIPEEVIHLETGWLTPEKDVDELSEAIMYFYHMNVAGLKKFSAAARHHISSNYDIYKNAQSLESIYLSMVEK